MIDLYTWSTSNGRKASIMLEEVGLPYAVHPVNIGKGEQLATGYLAISPNHTIPAIVDQEGPEGKPYSLFESGAILLYLAEKTGKLCPKEARGRYDVLQWLMFQMGGVGPTFSQANYTMRFAEEKVPPAIERSAQEVRRLMGVLESRLGASRFLAGDYSVADIATYPWVFRHEWYGVKLEEFPKVKRWFEEVGARPAVQRGMAVPQQP
jgi:GST-like protein